MVAMVKCTVSTVIKARMHNLLKLEKTCNWKKRKQQQSKCKNKPARTRICMQFSKVCFFGVIVT